MTSAQLRTFEGMRATGVHQRCKTAALSAVTATSTVARVALQVVAQKRVQKKMQVVLKDDIERLGKRGDLTLVPMGYWRNYLKPKALAAPATEGILKQIEAEFQAELRKKEQIKAKAQSIATALKTIGKFTLLKAADTKTGTIFGSVSVSEVLELVKGQTGLELDKKIISMPEIKEVGTYEASAQLHPEVKGTFKVVIQRSKESR